MHTALQALLDEIFKDFPQLQQAALTRRSHLEEVRGPGCYAPADHHERLETLGDAWLGAIVLRRLHDLAPRADEGQLTKIRSALVNNAALAAIARQHHLDGEIRAGKGEALQGQHLTDKSLASHVEALIGAAVLAGGEPAAARLIDLLWEGRWEAHALQPADNAKGELNEREQRQHRGSGTPRYETDRVTGTPDHDPRFRSTVILADGRRFTGGESKNTSGAEVEAAREALRAG